MDTTCDTIDSISVHFTDVQKMFVYDIWNQFVNMIHACIEKYEEKIEST